MARGITLFKIIVAFFFCCFTKFKKGIVAIKSIGLGKAGAKIARSRVSSKVIFAETYSVGRGVVDINITSDASREIINIGNEIIRNF